MNDLEKIMTLGFSDDDETYIIHEMTEALDLLVGDAKLSTSQRKKLSSGTFCGPGRSFPVPDCAHVTAARRLIGRAKGLSSDGRKRILSCVAGKSKSLGCGGSKDADETPLNVSDILDLWIKDLEFSAEVEDRLSTMETEVTDESKVQNRLDTVKGTLEEVTIDNVKLKEDNQTLKESVDTLTHERDTLLENNAGMIKDQHNALAERLVDMRITLRKPDMRDVFSSATADARQELRKAKIVEFAQRDMKSLEHAINDLAVEVDDIKSPKDFVESKAVYKDDDRMNRGRGKRSKATRRERVTSVLGIKPTSKGSQ